MFDVTLTKSAISQLEESQALNRHLSRLMTDISHGRGYVILQGATSVSVVARQEGERKVVKVYPLPLIEAARYTKEEALKRVTALKDPTQYRVVKFREAIAVQGEVMGVHRAELEACQVRTCNHTGMEIN